MTNAPVQPRTDATARGAASPDATQPADAAAVAADRHRCRGARPTARPRRPRPEARPGRRAGGADRHHRVRRRRVQEGQERAHQRPDRARRLPRRRRPRDDGGHGRPLRARAGRDRPAARGRGAAHRGDPGRRGRPLGRRDRRRRPPPRGRGGRGRAAEPVPRAGHRAGRHARGRWPQRRACRGHPGLPAVGRRARLRDRRLDRAVRVPSWTSCRPP